MEERKRREIDPTLSILRECLIEADEDAELDKATRAKMEEVLGFMEMLTSTYEDYKRLPPSTLKRILKMGGKIAKFFVAEKRSKT